MKNTSTKVPNKIKDPHFLARIRALISNEKGCEDCEFSPDRAKHKGRPHDLVDSKPVSHEEEYADELSTTVEVNVVDYSRFTFRLTSDGIPYPFFHYDSAGQAHRNRLQPLGKGDLIKCPHFNTFNEDGYYYAYRTDVIEDQEEHLGTHDFALNHFFIEGNIIPEEGVPSVKLDPKLFTHSSKNPVEGVHFT